MFRLFSILSAFGIFCTAYASAQTGTGYAIRVNLKNYAEKELILGYYYGDKTYVKDTAEVDREGIALFDGKEKLPAGIYILLRPSDNMFQQILVSDKEQAFTVNLNDSQGRMDITGVTGSNENKLFSAYMQYLLDKRKESDTYQELKKSATDIKSRQQATEKLEALDKEVNKYQLDFIGKNRGTLAALIVKANLSLTAPEFPGDEKAKNLSNYLWYNAHWFDHIDLSDERLAYTPTLYEKVNYYIEKLTPNHPDSIIVSVDRVLGMARGENYKFLVTTLLNNYAKSQLVGMDAVYVHIALNYYKTNKTPWVEKDQLEKIIRNAEALEPILIGKKAPALKVYSVEGKVVNLYDFQSEYTVLYFWNSNCASCKKGIASLKAAMEKYKNEGLRIFTVNTEIGPDAQDNFRNFIRNNGMEKMENTGDPEGMSGLKGAYFIRTTPQLFVLDKQKKILMKSIAADQLDEVLPELMKKNP